MSCQKFELLIALYVEGDLAPGEAGMVESHLGGCEGCRQFSAEMRTSQAALKVLRNEYIAPSAFEQVRSHVLATRPQAWLPLIWPRYAIAAGLLVVLLAGWLVRRHTENAVVGVESVHAIMPAPPAQPLLRPRPPKALAARERRRLRRQAPRFKTEPLVVKMITDDPQVVIYWLVDQNGG